MIDINYTIKCTVYAAICTRDKNCVLRIVMKIAISLVKIEQNERISKQPKKKKTTKRKTVKEKIFAPLFIPERTCGRSYIFHTYIYRCMPAYDMDFAFDACFNVEYVCVCLCVYFCCPALMVCLFF